MDSNFFLNNLWRWKCGLPEQEHPKPISFEELKKTEWDSEFENLMRNRLILGAIRYGRLREAGKPRYDRVDSIVSRISKYKESGNKEYLVDVANLCLLEYVECHHPKKHFSAIDDGEHVSILSG